jgi:hypothetical protein
MAAKRPDFVAPDPTSGALGCHSSREVPVWPIERAREPELAPRRRRPSDLGSMPRPITPDPRT